MNTSLISENFSTNNINSTRYDIRCPERDSNTNLSALLQHVAIVVVGCVGLLGNCVAIVSILNMKFKTTFHQSLIALSVCDILFITVVITDMNVDMAENFAFIYPYFWHPMRTILISLEAFLMMSISAERLLAVCKPIHYKISCLSYSSSIHFCVFILPSLFFSFIFNIPKYFETKLIYHSVTDVHHDQPSS